MLVCVCQDPAIGIPCSVVRIVIGGVAEILKLCNYNCSRSTVAEFEEAYKFYETEKIQ